MPRPHQPPTSSPPRDAPLVPGDKAPAFTLPTVDRSGETYTLDFPAALRGQRGLLVFYQDDGMPICTSELKAFAQEHDLLEEAGVRVFGINTNGVGSHAKFQERDHFPFPLISDFHGKVVKAYGLWDEDERKSRRAVVLVGEDGLVGYVQPHFNPGNLAAFEEVFDVLGLI